MQATHEASTARCRIEDVQRTVSGLTLQDEARVVCLAHHESWRTSLCKSRASEKVAVSRGHSLDGVTLRFPHDGNVHIDVATAVNQTRRFCTRDEVYAAFRACPELLRERPCTCDVSQRSPVSAADFFLSYIRAADERPYARTHTRICIINPMRRQRSTASSVTHKQRE